MKISLWFLFALLTFSCSVFENESNELSYRWEEDLLIVENGTEEVLYYSIFEQESLARINWRAHSTPENQLFPSTDISIDPDDIYDYEDGDNIAFIYWSGTSPSTEELKNMTIES